MKNNLKIFFTNRFVILGLVIVGFIVLQEIFYGNWLPTTETKDTWFYSGIFMVVFSLLVIEPYFSSPKNVITNVIPLLLVFIAIYLEFQIKWVWWLFFSYFLILLTISIFAMALDTKNESENSKRNIWANDLKNIAMFAGQGKVLYSSIFLYFLLSNYLLNEPYTIILLIFWAVVLILNPKTFGNAFWGKNTDKRTDAIGTVFGVQSKQMFLVKLFHDVHNVKKFDIVKFWYSMQENTDKFFVGIIFDSYLLNQEQWVKVLQLKEEEKRQSDYQDDVVYKSDEEHDLNIKGFVGVVVEGSNIGKIKFEYSKQNDDLQEGDLLELQIGKKKIFYQVVNAHTNKELLEAKNESGIIEGEAIQLGERQNSTLSFQKFGWVPQINTPLFTANTNNETPDIEAPNYKLGIIPKTNFPSTINLNDAISHHIALLGVTGSGKSFLAREIINQLKTDTKIICVDFNKEFVAEITPAPNNIISDTDATEIATNIDWINNELDKFANNQDKQEIQTKQTEITDKMKTSIETFLSGNDSISIFELPDVSNTTGILDYTKFFFKTLFAIAKEKQQGWNPVKICVVLEEAHTIIPEWNFLGSNDKSSQSIVNTIGQVALQGRKYGVGFMIIAQRTANVSKTVLTQCNTVICFQAFDETSFHFLGNYVGKDMVEALPNLKLYHAVVAGKALKSNMPMIVDLTRNSLSPNIQQDRNEHE